jgi:type IV secretion system protein VirD4
MRSRYPTDCRTIRLRSRLAAKLLCYLAAACAVLVAVAAARRTARAGRRLPGLRAPHLRVRLWLRLHPGRGFATLAELHLRWGRLTAARHAVRIRPSLTTWQRVTRPAEHTVFLGRAHLGHGLRVPVEEHILVMAPPRTGKTAFLADVMLGYPGPVLATTTKDDLRALTSPARSLLGPVHVFNPQAIGGTASTFAWSPVAGCEDPATAIRRADAFAYAVSQRDVEDGGFWAAKASDYLRAFFHAAALAGYDLRAVARWVSATRAAAQAEQILHAAGAAEWADMLAELRGGSPRTVATVRMVMSRALSFLADPALADAVLPGPAAYQFDPAEFVTSGGTLYMTADTTAADAPVAPLFAALATEVHHAAAQAGQASPATRLDPPLLMGLDEIAQVCPVPLPSWLADSGGKGIQVVAVAHGQAQLAARWHDHGGQAIWDTSSVKVFLPGITDVTTLDAASRLCGQAAFRVRRQPYRAWHEVATPDMIRQLPGGHALVIRGGCAPVITKLPRRGATPPAGTPAAAPHAAGPSLP